MLLVKAGSAALKENTSGAIPVKGVDLLERGDVLVSRLSLNGTKRRLSSIRTAICIIASP
jgi:hypothetical protein